MEAAEGDEEEDDLSYQSTEEETFIPSRALENPVYLFFFKICTLDSFNFFIIACIVFNTMLLAMDRHPITRTQ